jgi:xanthine dehydrogenase molybdopterin-binding subunit B
MDDKTMQPLAAWTEVGRQHPHESAVLHVLGEAAYTDDMPELQGTLHAALGLSALAHGTHPRARFRRRARRAGRARRAHRARHPRHQRLRTDPA